MAKKENAFVEDEAVDEAVVGRRKKMKKEKKGKSRFVRALLSLAVVTFCVYAVYDIVNNQTEIEKLKKETADMTEKISETKQLNDEYQSLIDSDDDEYMERVAVEQLGYAYPNERRFYIVRGSDD
jgi:cell division protein FtsL